MINPINSKRVRSWQRLRATGVLSYLEPNFSSFVFFSAANDSSMVLYSNLVADVFWTEEWTMGECLWLQDQTFGLPTETMSVRHQHSKFWQTVIIRHIYILTASNSMSATFSSSFFGLAKLRRHASGVSFRSAIMSAITTSSRRFVRSQRRWQNGNPKRTDGPTDACLKSFWFGFGGCPPPRFFT